MLDLSVFFNNRAVAAERAVLQKPFDLRGILSRNIGKAAACGIIGFNQGHPVLGKGSCLIRTDNRRAPQCFHGGKPSDDGVLLYHPLDADRQNDGNNCGKPLRNG